MTDEKYFWLLVLAGALATQITRFAPFFFMKFLEQNRLVQKVNRNLPPCILSLLIIYCFKDHFTGGISFSYSLLLPLAILIYLQVRTRNALLSIGVATAAHAFLLKI